MKIIGVTFNANSEEKISSENTNVFLKPDTAVHNSELPFFFPNFTNEIEIQWGIVLKINKLGKCISEKFVPNYFQEIALAMSLKASDLVENFKINNKNNNLAFSWDNSFILGDFLPKNNFELPQNNIKIIQNEVSEQISVEKEIEKIPQILSYVSEFITFKKGDLLFIGLNFPEKKLLKGDKWSVFQQENKILSIEIK